MQMKAMMSPSQLVGRRPKNQKVTSLIPGWAHAWIVGLVPGWAHTEGNRSMFLSHIDVSLPLFLSSFPSLIKTKQNDNNNKKVRRSTPIPPSNSTPKGVPKRNENGKSTWKFVHKCLCGYIMPQKVETAQISINW